MHEQIKKTLLRKSHVSNTEGVYRIRIKSLAGFAYDFFAVSFLTIFFLVRISKVMSVFSFI